MHTTSGPEPSQKVEQEGTETQGTKKALHNTLVFIMCPFCTQERDDSYSSPSPPPPKSTQPAPSKRDKKATTDPSPAKKRPWSKVPRRATKVGTPGGQKKRGDIEDTGSDLTDLEESQRLELDGDSLLSSN